MADLREQVQSLQELMELQSFQGGQANPLDLEIYKGDAAMQVTAHPGGGVPVDSAPPIIVESSKYERLEGDRRPRRR